MWTVQRPSFDPEDTFLLCISRVRDTNLRQRLRQVRSTIADDSDDFKTKATNAELHLVEATDGVGNVVTTDEMVAVYDRRMAKKGSPGRVIYDQIKSLPKYDTCPFCDHRDVSTLDHILPKAEYPSLAVTPLNLVGSCMECNKSKLTLVPSTAGEAILHPYFDNVGGHRWLNATVVAQTPCAVVFVVVPPTAWSAVVRQRAKAQFKLLGLASLYTNQAARQISNMRLNLRQHFDDSGRAGVRAELVRQYESYSANELNSWQAAMYRALSESDWFCDGGFG